MRFIILLYFCKIIMKRKSPLLQFYIENSASSKTVCSNVDCYTTKDPMKGWFCRPTEGSLYKNAYSPFDLIV